MIAKDGRMISKLNCLILLLREMGQGKRIIKIYRVWLRVDRVRGRRESSFVSHKL